MSFKPITVNTPATDPAHILAQDDATLYHGILGQDCVLDIGSKMEAVIIDNNTVRIRDGAVMVQGHLGRIPHGEYEDLHIENGVAGQKRHDLIVARFETTAGIDTYKLAVIKGVSGTEGKDPDITTGNLDKGDTLREYPLYRVKIDGLLLAEVEKIHTLGSTIGLLNQSIVSHLADYETAHGIDKKADKGIISSATIPKQNGWSGPLGVYKHDTGLVHIRGSIAGGVTTNGTVIGVIPDGYRPRDYTVTIPIYNRYRGVALVGIVISSSGNMQITSDAADGTSEGQAIDIHAVYYSGGVKDDQ